MRATNWDELMGLMDVMFANEEQNYRSFVAQPDDIVISPFAKSGTTWLQQLTHQLRTGGHTDFEDIYDVVPFLDVAADIGIDVNGPQITSPQLMSLYTGSGDPGGPAGLYCGEARLPLDARPGEGRAVRVQADVAGREVRSLFARAEPPAFQAEGSP